MADTIVLVRHAAAQACTEGQQDKLRELTGAGRRCAEEVLPKVLGLLDSIALAKDAVVWSSPATRALQTAQIVATALGVDSIEAREQLYADAVSDALLDDILAQDGTLVIVGHNPQFEELARQLSGQSISLNKGCCLCLSCDEGGVHGYKVDCFVRGRDPRSWENIGKIEEALSECAARIEKNSEAFFSNPEDTETLHQYRISLRVARSLVGFLKPYLKSAYYKRLESALKQLARMTSRQRELDVMLGTLTKRGANTVEDAALIVECAREQARNRKVLLKALKGKKDRDSQDGFELLGSVIAMLPCPRWNPTTLAHGISRKALGAHYDELAVACDEELASCDFGDVESTHNIRKSAKRLRYIAREFKELLGEERIEAGKRAKKVQDKLGELCDARVNYTLSNELASASGMEGQTFAESQNEDITRLLGDLGWDHPCGQDSDEDVDEEGAANRPALQ